MAKHPRDESEDTGVNPTSNSPLNDVIGQRLSRREALQGMAATAAAGVIGSPLAALPAAAAEPKSSLTFREVGRSLDQNHHLADGYEAQVLVRWGDKVTADAPDFDVNKLTAEAQLKQFGYDNDFLAFMPLPMGSTNSKHGLLCSNHERVSAHLVWPGLKPDYSNMTREQAEIEMAAQGVGVLEVKRGDKGWQVVADSRYNRRITALTGTFQISGPVAGHARVKTNADPTGTWVGGTLNNCAGGKTPWGTILSGEENLQNYFLGDPAKSPEASNLRRLGVSGKPRYQWGRWHDRFDLAKEPNEPNRFGWVVEVDPYNPNNAPKKRTALGRFKHEGATTAVSHDGRVAVYSGDDERFEYVYKFVTSGRYDPKNRAANSDLLDSGTLYVARFDGDGTMTWLPLVHGQGPLTAANGFASQADVLIETRRAADLMGATPMDRPEDVEPHPQTGRVYVVLTFNERRKPATDANARERVNAANPRANNKFGHIIEIAPPLANGKPDHAAEKCRWDFFLLGGDPADAAHGAKYQGPVTKQGWVAAPDNIAFDPRGRMWIATDGQDDAAGFADSLYGADVRGPGRGMTRAFFNAPRGAEVCGPEFTPDGNTLFLAIQHPGEEDGSTIERPSTRWPDFKEGVPPRPSVIAITKKGGGTIGS